MPIDIFPYANVIVGILVFVIGFIFHWIGQIISLINWDFAAKIGIAEKNTLPEYKVYELGIAAADALLGWIYGIAAVGLILNISWLIPLLWFPGVVFVYHGLSFWFWIGNQNKLGKPTTTNNLRIGWSMVNFITGLLAILIAL